MFGKVVKFFNELKVELTKVSWPTRKELVSSSSIVIFSTAVLAIFISMVDFILSRFLGMLLK